MQMEYLSDTEQCKACICCSSKRPREEVDTDEDSIPLEEDTVSAKVAPRAHKRAMRRAAKQYEEGISYFDPDE